MDMEKVIKGLERCSYHDGTACLSCPYDKADCVDDLCADALALLKEQGEKMEHLNNITLEYEKEVFRLQTLLKKKDEKLVRCKDCKNADYGTDEDGNRFMKCIGSVKCYGGTTPDFFCADGERKEVK